MLALRYALLPYWYGTYVTATRTGLPIVRPLWFEFPADEHALSRDDEFFLGPWLLAAPVTAPNVTARDVYLPPGYFYDYYTGAGYQGPATIAMPAPLGRIPLFVRAGAVLPAQDVVDYVGAPSSGRKYIDVFPGAVGSSGTVELYEDDGETTAYLSGAFATTTVSSAVTATGLTLDIAAPNGAFKTPATALVVRIHGVSSAPAELSIDGASVPVGYDIGTRVVTLPALAPSTAHAVVVRYDASSPPQPRQVNVDLTFTVPPATPAGDIYVGASALAWKPDGIKLTRIGNMATGRLTVLEGTLVKLKVTRGTWATVEVNASCGELANRELIAEHGASGGTAVQFAVAAFADRCP